MASDGLKIHSRLAHNLLLPHRRIGTLTHVDAITNRFGVALKIDDAIHPAVLRQQIHENFVDPSNKECFSSKLMPRAKKPEVGKFYGVYVESLDQVARAKLLNKNGGGKVLNGSPVNKMDVLLIDYGMHIQVPQDSIFELSEVFFKHPYDVALSLACQLPDVKLIEMYDLPKIANFKVGDHVEVIILSDKEPCLALVGATASRVNSIHRDILSSCMDVLIQDVFQKTLTLPMLPAEKDFSKGWEMNSWKHSDEWTLVTAVASFDASNVCIRDIFTSLRFISLQDAINRSYKQPEFRADMALDISRISSGSPVIVYSTTLKSFIRGTITNMMDGFYDVKALDIPDVEFTVEYDCIFHPSSMLLYIPPQLYQIKCTDEENQEKVAYAFTEMEKLLMPDSVAIVKLNPDQTMAEVENSKTVNVISCFSECIDRMEFPTFEPAETTRLSVSSFKDDIDD